MHMPAVHLLFFAQAAVGRQTDAFAQELQQQACSYITVMQQKVVQQKTIMARLKQQLCDANLRAERAEASAAAIR